MVSTTIFFHQSIDSKNLRLLSRRWQPTTAWGNPCELRLEMKGDGAPMVFQIEHLVFWCEKWHPLNGDVTELNLFRVHGDDLLQKSSSEVWKICQSPELPEPPRKCRPGFFGCFLTVKKQRGLWGSKYGHYSPAADFFSFCPLLWCSIPIFPEHCSHFLVQWTAFSVGEHGELFKFWMLIACNNTHLFFALWIRFKQQIIPWYQVIFHFSPLFLRVFIGFQSPSPLVWSLNQELSLEEYASYARENQAEGLRRLEELGPGAQLTPRMIICSYKTMNLEIFVL